MSHGITVSIGESVTHDPGMGGKHAKFVSYPITSESTKSGFRPGSFSVDRRYSDFCWLTDEFARELPGCIIPPLPEKVAVGRFERDFIDSRQRGLLRFLHRVIAHPDLSSSHLLVIFLQSDEAAFTRAKEDSKASRPKMATSAVTWFEGKVNSIAYGKAEIDRTPEDVKIEEMLDYVVKLEKQLTVVAKHSDALVKKSKDTASTMFDLGSAFSALGQSDVDGAGGELTQCGASVEQTSNALSLWSDSQLTRVHEPLEDYLRLTGAVKAAIQRRHEKKKAYVAALTDVDAKGAVLRKAQATPGKDTSSKETALAGAEAMRDAAKADFDRVTDRLLHEFESFKETKVHDMKVVVSQFVELQLHHNRAVESLWEEAAPKLQLSPGGPSIRPFSSSSYSKTSASSNNPFSASSSSSNNNNNNNANNSHSNRSSGSFNNSNNNSNSHHNNSDFFEAASAVAAGRAAGSHYPGTPPPVPGAPPPVPAFEDDEEGDEGNDSDQ